MIVIDISDSLERDNVGLKMINYQLKAKYGSQWACLAAYKSYFLQLDGKENWGTGSWLKAVTELQRWSNSQPGYACYAKCKALVGNNCTVKHGIGISVLKNI